MVVSSRIRRAASIGGGCGAVAISAKLYAASSFHIVREKANSPQVARLAAISTSRPCGKAANKKPTGQARDAWERAPRTVRVRLLGSGNASDRRGPVSRACQWEPHFAICTPALSAVLERHPLSLTCSRRPKTPSFVLSECPATQSAALPNRRAAQHCDSSTPVSFFAFICPPAANSGAIP